MATGRREDDSHTATLLPQRKPPARSPFLALPREVLWSGGEESARARSSSLLSAGFSPMGPGSTEMLGVKRNNHYFFFFIW